MNVDALLDGGYLPHAVIRMGIRRNLKKRLSQVATPDLATATAQKQAYVDAMRGRPIAIATDTANRQHYEVGTGVLAGTLGPYMKYSSCLYPEIDGAGPSQDPGKAPGRMPKWLAVRLGGFGRRRTSLAEAEIAMLSSYIDKAQLADGMRILDLGCGWGSCSLFLAERLPAAQITALSNSRSQKAYIDDQARQRGLTNLTVITANIVDFEFVPASFDRVVSIELFEHMKNHDLLMAKVARGLRPGGKLFVHIFCHAATAYDYEDGDGWMATYFFTGGTMMSADLLHYCQRDLALERQWWVSGRHYSRTCEDWLCQMQTNKARLMPALAASYGGPEQAAVWFRRWQIFYMACSELFNHKGGDVWGVAHYLFSKAE